MYYTLFVCVFQTRRYWRFQQHGPKPQHGSGMECFFTLLYPEDILPNACHN